MGRDKEFLKEWNEILMAFALEFKTLQENKKNMCEEEFKLKDKELAKKIEEACKKVKAKYNKQ